MTKTVYVILKAQVPKNMDLVELDGQLYDLEQREVLDSVTYWHVSERGYLELAPSPKRARKRKPRKARK